MNEVRPTPQELAWGLVEIFDELSIDHINEMLAKNVPMGTLECISAYAEQFAQKHGLEDEAGRSLPNLMLLGYLMRLVEERTTDRERLAVHALGLVEITAPIE